MRTKKHNRPREFGDVPFTVIAEELGISKQRAWQLYESGMRKLRARPRLLKRLLDLARAKEEAGL